MNIQFIFEIFNIQTFPTIRFAIRKFTAISTNIARIFFFMSSTAKSVPDDL